MEVRRHPTFARRLLWRSLFFFTCAVLSLLLGMAAERFDSVILKVLGYLGFGMFSLGIFGSAQRSSLHSPCPQCQRMLFSEEHRDKDKPLYFYCQDCQVAWDTQGIINLW